jgi:hypothetical protein
VLITTRGKMVFVAESFPLPLAHKLTDLILDAQFNGAVRMTELNPPAGSHTTENQPVYAPLSGDLVHVIESCGITKAVVDASLRTAR